MARLKVDILSIKSAALVIQPRYQLFSPIPLPFKWEGCIVATLTTGIQEQAAMRFAQLTRRIVNNRIGQ